MNVHDVTPSSHVDLTASILYENSSPTQGRTLLPLLVNVINRGDFTCTDMDETADVVQQILGYGRRLEKYIERGNEEFKVQ